MLHALANSIVKHDTGMDLSTFHHLAIHAGALCKAIQDESATRVVREMELIKRTLPPALAEVYFPAKKLAVERMESHSATVEGKTA